MVDIQAAFWMHCLDLDREYHHSRWGAARPISVLGSEQEPEAQWSVRLYQVCIRCITLSETSHNLALYRFLVSAVKED